MVTLLLKKSYRHRDLKEITFKDLWNSYGIFTTMRVIGKPAKILFFKDHINNLIKSLKTYKVYKNDLKKNILKLIKLNLKKNKKYDHLLRVAVNNKMISISLRKRLKPNSNFVLKLINYKKILSILNKMDTTKYDIALYKSKKIIETGTSNLLFVQNNKIYSPINEFYKGTTLKFFSTKTNIYKKNIFINSLNLYDEIIVIGSGKGVVSVSKIKNMRWKRKSLNFYKKLSNIYKKEIIMSPIYR